MGGKTSTSTSQTAIPQAVLDNYTNVNKQANAVAATPFQQYSSDPNSFVAPLTATQQAGILGANQAAGQAQPYFGAAATVQNDAYSGGQAANTAAGNQYGSAYTGAQPYNGAALGDYAAATAAAAPGNTAAAQNYASAQTKAQPYDSSAAVHYYEGVDATHPLNDAAGKLYQSGLGSAVNYNTAGAAAANPTQLSGQAINKYLSPYLGDVLSTTEGLVNQNNQQQQAGQLGTAISSGAFGGDRAGIAAANLAQQQTLAEGNLYSGIANQGYNTALATAQQQQGVGLAAQQANLARLTQAGQNIYADTSATGQNLAALGQQQFGQQEALGQNLAGLGQQIFGQASTTGQNQAALAQQRFGQESAAAQNIANLGQQVYGQGSQYGAALQGLGQQQFAQGTTESQNLAGLGTGAQAAGLSGAQAQLAAGQSQQQTQQAGLTALYNQFLQQQGYPFQTAQFLANIAEGTGSLSGSTTTTTQPAPFFSDERLKEDIEPIGKTFDGGNIVKFRYKGSPQKQIGLVAQDVEKHHPEAVGSSLGFKTVDYDAATKDAARMGSNLGEARTHLAYGGVGGGPASPYDVSAILAAQQAGYSGAPWAKAGLYEGTPSGSPGLGGYVPKANLPVSHLVTPASVGARPPESDLAQIAQAAQQASQLATAGKTLGGGAQSLWNSTIGAPAPAVARGGIVDRDHFGIGGAPAGDSSIDPYGDPNPYIPDEQPRNLRLLGSPTPANQTPSPLTQLTQLGSEIGTLGTAASSIGGLFFSRGGYADGGADDDVASPLSAVGSAVSGGFGDLGDSVGAARDWMRRKLIDTPPGAGGDPTLDAIGARVGDVRSAGRDAAHAMADTASADPAEPPLTQRQPSRDLASVPGYSAASTPANSNAPPSPPADLGSTNVIPLPPRRPSGLGDVAAAPPAPDASGVTMGHYNPHGRQQVWSPDSPAASLGDVPATAYRADTSQNPIEGMKANIAQTETGGSRNPYSQLGPATKSGDYPIGKYQVMASNVPSWTQQVLGKAMTPDEFRGNPQAQDAVATAKLGDYAQKTGSLADAASMWFTGRPLGAGGAGASDVNGMTGAHYAALATDGLGGGSGAAAPHTLASAPSTGLAGVPAAAGNWVNKNQNWLLPILSGLGGMASSNSRYLGSAVLQGLGTGADTYAKLENQAAQRGLTQAETGRTEAQTQKQEADTQEVMQGISQKARYVDAYGRMWVHTADGRIMSDQDWDKAGRPSLFGQTASAAPTEQKLPQSPAPLPPAAPAAPLGIHMDARTLDTAKNDLQAMTGPQYADNIKLSADYAKNTRDASLAAQATQPYTQELAKTLSQAYQNKGINAPGAGFDTRSNIVSIGNTLERMYNKGADSFGPSDSQSAIVNKYNTLQGLMRAQGAGETAVRALDTLKDANPNLTQNPEASSALVAQLMADQVKANDRAAHAKIFASGSGGTYYGAQDDFNRINGPQVYNHERDQLQDMLLHWQKGIEKMTSGNYSSERAQQELQKRKDANGNPYDPALARYFISGG